MMKANEKRAIVSRDTDKVVNTSHHSNLQVSANTPESELFSKNPTCILNQKERSVLFGRRASLTDPIFAMASQVFPLS